jgi:hypothetical protein
MNVLSFLKIDYVVSGGENMIFIGEIPVGEVYKKRKGSKSDLLPFAKFFRTSLITSSF